MTYSSQYYSMAIIDKAIHNNTETFSAQAVKANTPELEKIICNLNTIYCSLNTLNNSLEILYKNLQKLNSALIRDMLEKERKS